MTSTLREPIQPQAPLHRCADASPLLAANEDGDRLAEGRGGRRTAEARPPDLSDFGWDYAQALLAWSRAL